SNTATKLRAIARDFAFPLSDAAVQTWMKAIVQGTRTEDDFLAYAREQAKMLFPTIAGAIDAGIAPSQYFDPYRQIAARTLSLNPEQIDLSDPKWMSALAVTDEQGNRVPMRLDQWEAHIKSDERYGYHLTQQADREAEALVDFVGRMFGK